MKILTSTTHKGLLPRGNNQGGFTLIEVLISMVILTIGIFGLIQTASSVIFFQKHSANVTEATLKTANKIEEVKRLSANEPTGGIFGFTYLTSTYLTDEGFTEVDDQTYSKLKQMEISPKLWFCRFIPQAQPKRLMSRQGFICWKFW